MSTQTLFVESGNSPPTKKKKCPHGKQRPHCKDCGGSVFCEHGRERRYCKECGGSGICEHNRVRSVCKPCGGVSICEHGRVRSACKKCGGSGICEHGRQRGVCKECGGSQICDHGKVRTYCKECCPIGVYKRYAYNAKVRCHQFNISFGEYQAITTQPCFYCGAHDETNGMDQVIAGEGYTPSNVASCCSDCNEMKNDRSIDDFLQHVNRITKFQEQRYGM